jgi:predicted regulator of Ras-like GTPase activity (Roadblock/LC7/MglB family)
VANATSFSTTPRQRFFEEAPKVISVPLAELLAKLPRELLRDSSVDGLNERNAEVPCSDLLAGNTPRLSLGQLHDLLPDLVIVPEGRDHSERLSLPAGWVALYYKLVTRVEEGQEERRTIIPTVVDVSLTSLTEVTSEKPFPGPMIKAEEISPVVIENPSTQEAHGSKSLQEEANSESAPVTPVAPVAAAAIPKRGFFASLPIFRRNLSTKPVSEESRLTVATPAASETSGNAKRLRLETLWKLDPLDQIAEPAALQKLFMTEEKLTLDRVISLAGQLPGLRACVLAHGDQVVCASNTPQAVDLQTLSGQAMTMLAQIKESSTNMGIGAVPAVTLHAEQGALSFLHNGELCLLVLHADRGFLPGVRERLQEMLGHVAQAKALPNGSTAQPSLPI